MTQPKITPNAIKVLWSCSRCGESLIKRPPLRSHAFCPHCKQSMRIEKVLEAS